MERWWKPSEKFSSSRFARGGGGGAALVVGTSTKVATAAAPRAISLARKRFMHDASAPARRLPVARSTKFHGGDITGEAGGLAAALLGGEPFVSPAAPRVRETTRASMGVFAQNPDRMAPSSFAPA